MKRLGLLILLGLLAPGLPWAQDVERGHALAERWCGNCHLVERSAATAHADGLPTFTAIASKPTTTEGSLRGFMTAAHGRMPDFNLGVREQNDLIAYIFSLRAR
jgi:hypothetical protein